MIYDIEQGIDMTGVTLKVRFPANEVDDKALLTIQNERPGFLVPFDFRIIDTTAECIYRLGSLTKLIHRFGERTPGEFLEFCRLLYEPILTCGDWFLKPNSFVMDERYLYTNRDGSMIYYMYVPSRQNCEGMGALEQLTGRLLVKNGVTDKNVHNAALLALTDNYHPARFMNTIREAVNQSMHVDFHRQEAAPTGQEGGSVPPGQDSAAPVWNSEPERDSAPVAGGRRDRDSAALGAECGELDIQFDNPNPKRAKKEKAKRDKEEKKQKKEAVKKEKQSGGLFNGLFRKKDSGSEEIRAGAQTGDYPQQGVPSAQGTQGKVLHNPKTQIEIPSGKGKGSTPFLRLIGHADLDKEIVVPILPGEVFTIGRYDSEIGKKQSNYEFPGNFRSVSRHHAVIERDKKGNYILFDDSSMFGTFLNGVQLKPNDGRPLFSGNRVSFGPKGADYIWEDMDASRGI